MTRKDYIKIADIIKGNMVEQIGFGLDLKGDTIYDIGHPNRKRMINELCDYFKQDNSKFNEMKFKNYIKGAK